MRFPAGLKCERPVADHKPKAASELRSQQWRRWGLGDINNHHHCERLPSVIASASEATLGFRDISTAAISQPPWLLRRFAPRNYGGDAALLAIRAMFLPFSDSFSPPVTAGCMRALLPESGFMNRVLRPSSVSLPTFGQQVAGHGGKSVAYLQQCALEMQHPAKNAAKVLGDGSKSGQVCSGVAGSSAMLSA